VLSAEQKDRLTRRAYVLSVLQTVVTASDNVVAVSIPATHLEDEKVAAAREQHLAVLAQTLQAAASIIPDSVVAGGYADGAPIESDVGSLEEGVAIIKRARRLQALVEVRTAARSLLLGAVSAQAGQAVAAAITAGREQGLSLAEQRALETRLSACNAHVHLTNATVGGEAGTPDAKTLDSAIQGAVPLVGEPFGLAADDAVLAAAKRALKALQAAAQLAAAPASTDLVVKFQAVQVGGEVGAAEEVVAPVRAGLEEPMAAVMADAQQVGALLRAALEKKDDDLTVEYLSSAMTLTQAMGLPADHQLMQQAAVVLHRLKARDAVLAAAQGSAIDPLAAAVEAARTAQVSEAIVAVAERRLAELQLRAELRTHMDAPAGAESTGALSSAVGNAETLGEAYGFGAQDRLLLQAKAVLAVRLAAGSSEEPVIVDALQKALAAGLSKDLTDPLYLQLALIAERGDELRAAEILTRAVDALEARDITEVAEIQQNADYLSGLVVRAKVAGLTDHDAPVVRSQTVVRTLFARVEARSVAHNVLQSGTLEVAVITSALQRCVSVGLGTGATAGDTTVPLLRARLAEAENALSAAAQEAAAARAAEERKRAAEEAERARLARQKEIDDFNSPMNRALREIASAMTSMDPFAVKFALDLGRAAGVPQDVLAPLEARLATLEKLEKLAAALAAAIAPGSKVGLEQLTTMTDEAEAAGVDKQLILQARARIRELRKAKQAQQLAAAATQEVLAALTF
jgi:hypothetical protein